jgi:hypothetical protein
MILTACSSTHWRTRCFVMRGVKVLSGVSNDVNCLFLHLQENPLRCDRSADAATNDSVNNIRRISMMESDSNARHKKRARNLIDDKHHEWLAGGTY